jgi:hypothetical protein
VFVIVDVLNTLVYFLYINKMEDFTNQLDTFVTKNKSTKEEFEKWIGGLDDKQLLDALKDANPYGISHPNKPHDDPNRDVLCFSYTNYRLAFAKQYAVTGMVGYLFRRLMEYKVADEVKHVDIEEYMADPSIADTPAIITDDRLLKLHQANRDMMVDRVAVFKFLKSVFKYDPDVHVRSSYKANKANDERRRPEPLKTDVVVGNTIRKRDTTDPADQDYVPEAGDEAAMLTNVPPADLFYGLNRYMSEHHELMQKCVYDVYGSKPDVDLAVIPYKVMKDSEVNDFKNRYMDQVIAPITSIDLGRWGLLGPYAQNRERVDFINRKTEVLKEMLDKREQDSKLGADVMAKRVKRKRDANVVESGPTHPKFKQWLKANKPKVAQMGADYLGDDEDDDDSCPIDKVEIPVYSLGDGGQELEVHKIYNPVEAPIGKSALEEKKE